MAVIRTYGDGRYEWRCEDCSNPHWELPHRGPRKMVCKACQNKRYQHLGGDALRERNRPRMRLRRRVDPRQDGPRGPHVGPQQRCFPLRQRAPDKRRRFREPGLHGGQLPVTARTSHGMIDV